MGAAPGDPTTQPAPHEFELDAFQRDAIAALDAGQSVLVAAPTGAGKTVVAEHAVALTLARGQGARIFYTTPIKALSNQKYADLVRRHGRDAVGLLTGDNAVNGDAPVVVMTTEVLRNMVYGGSPALDRLQFVVLDEVHYLQDAYRGPVWEEVMIHLDPAVRLVCLSATVSNAHELADWIATIRGPTATVIEHERPVELANLYLVGDRDSSDLALVPTLVDGRPNPEGDRFDVDSRPGPRRARPRRRWYTPRRLEVVDELAGRDLLPAIYFIFSRNACDDAAAHVLDAGLRLTTAAERERIGAIVDQRVAPLTDDDLDVLGYARFRAGLEAGVAAHHAGMVPPFKEAVEACFVEGLVKVVFATETLALGINMPARTVVIEKLSKFTGDHHELLTPGQYTQITGRAGRRGIDPIGHAIVLWSPFTSFGQVAGLAASRTFELTSAFRPTYNMAANLVHRYPPEQAHHLLNLSFAQYRADREVVRLEQRLDARRKHLAELRADATCELGDVDEYRRLVAGAEPPRRAAPRGVVEAALAHLHPGDVLVVPGHDRAVVLSVAHRQRGAVRVRALTTGRKVLTLGAPDFPQAPAVTGRIELPEPYAPNNEKFRKAAAEALRKVATGRLPADGTGRRGDRGDRGDDGPAVDHPVAACPDAPRHVAAARRADRGGREVSDLERRVRGHTESLARQFDRVLTLLEEWGHLRGWALTWRGEVLGRIYHECDLLIAESLAAGLLDGLDPAALAGLVSCFTYEHRSPTPPAAPWFPSARVRERVDAIERLAADLNHAEQAAGLPLTRPPEPGFFALAHAWAAGEPLDEVLDDEDLSGGDFVRNAKQLIDLLRQVGDVAPDPATRRTARVAADELFRGVVSASSVVGEPDADGQDGGGQDGAGAPGAGLP